MIQITCNTYDPVEGERRTLARFGCRTDGTPVFQSRTELSDALSWLDDLLCAVKGLSLFSQLNEIQAECNLDRNPKPFPSKTDIPLCILNLVLEKHGLRMEQKED